MASRTSSASAHPHVPMDLGRCMCAADRGGSGLREALTDQGNSETETRSRERHRGSRVDICEGTGEGTRTQKDRHSHKCTYRLTGRKT